jgi:hypothetical protein
VVVTWWKRKKCPLCKTVLKKKNGSGKLNMETAEGPLELEICMGCSIILEKSSEILHGSRKRDNGREASEEREIEEDNIRI